MYYSFTEAKTKRLLKTDTKLWIFFFIVLYTFFFFLYMFLGIRIAATKQTNIETKATKQALQKEIIDIKDIIEKNQRKERLAYQVKQSNLMLKDNLKSLFHLIPDQVHINYANIGLNTMQLKGFVPSEDVYNRLLKPPLESIFDNSKASFYELENGWFKFVSDNQSKVGYLYGKVNG